MARERPGSVSPPSLSSSPEPSASTKRSEETLTDDVKAKVNMFPQISQSLSELMHNFKAGQVSHHLSEWESPTTDPEILQIVQGDTTASDPQNAGQICF